MSRQQEGDVDKTATGQNSQYYNNAQSSYTGAQADEGDYEDQLSKYAAGNPYKAGGEFQTSENQVLSNTAGASAKAAGETLQSQALRTGQNANGAVAATEQMQEANERALGGQEAEATQARIGDEANYNAGVLQDTAQPVAAETQLAGQQAGAAGGTLDTAQKAAATPSWMDELGQGVATGLGSAIGGGWAKK